MSDIELRPLGDSGLQVSVLGLGCNNFGRRLDAAGSTLVVHAALEQGVTLFDTADIYGDGRSEEILGAALQGRRESAIIATKFGYTNAGDATRGGASPRWIRQAVEDSLRRLGTEWIDLYQLHTPDASTPIAETLETLTALVREGKVRAVGSSNLAGWQIADADWTSRSRGLTRFVSAQNHYNLLERAVEDEVVPACAHYGIGLIPYLPLAGGMLTGKHRRGEGAAPGTRLERVPDLAAGLLVERNYDVVDSLRAFASERGRSLLDVAIGGLAAQPQVVSVIAGAMSPEQVRANAAAARWRPGENDLLELRRVAPRR